MKQHEEVIKIMEENGGWATLGFLYHHVDTSEWKTKTPFATIRRIVQDERFFFKIKAGLWALKSHKEQLLEKFELEVSSKKEQDFSHSYFQGLLVEIGNLKGYHTYIPPQDKNKLFLDRKLGSVSSLGQILDFTYPEVIKRAKTIDVIWFNERKFPHAFFEVEHTTDIQNSLLKFNELQDFYTKFYILSAAERKREFEQKIAYTSFKDIRNRVSFIDYDFVANLHTKSFELLKIGQL
ncbi:hypothetical protein [uncultured Capnocytophaga sp.]|uniref:hypothetical protein n=1 Tax=uncultured Capnocytophaga sp. TaxID=159273 RepID=UPI00261E5321|nr:hypothetical protein [uncultured Capnocytophaga sp.]